MSQPTLDQILTIPDQPTVEATELLPTIQSLGARITDWLIGAPYRTLIKAVGFMRVDVRSMIATLAAANFEDYVFGFATLINPFTGLPIDVTSFAPFVALQRYRVQQIAASYTKRLITLTNTSNAAYGPLKSGAIILQFGATKNRYVLDVQPSGDGTTTIPAQVAGVPGTVQAVFRSYFVSNTSQVIDYSVDTPGAAISFVTASYPGVTATNPAPTYSTPLQNGSGLGTVTPSGVPAAGSHFVTVYIDGTGNVAGGTVVWSAVLDNGVRTSYPGVTSALIGAGITVTLTDNGGAPNFVVGAYYYFQTPGTDVVQVGADVETPQQLGTRVRGLWPSLAFVQDSAGNWIPKAPTASAYKALALSVNGQVRVALVVTDGNVNNKVLITIAGQGGALLPASVIANEQAFFNAFAGGTDNVFVQPSTLRTITYAGVTIYCKSSLVTAAQVALTKRLSAYIGGVDTSAPLGINGADGRGFVDYDYSLSLIRTTTAVVQVAGTLTINGASQDLALPVAPGFFESPALPIGFDAKTAFTWVPV